MSIEIQKPFIKDFPVTQKFGALYKYLGKTYTHYGVDYGCPGDTPIRACADGVVLRVKRIYLPFSYGKEVRITHGRFLSQYAHLNKIIVEEGDVVRAGDLLGFSGRTGYCRGVTGYHLHFGIQKNGIWIDPVPLFEKPEPGKETPLVPSDKLVPLFRLYHPKTGDHFVATAEEEVDQAIKKYGYEIEGVLGFVYEPK